MRRGPSSRFLSYGCRVVTSIDLRLRTAVEQAIARGLTPEQIHTQLDVAPDAIAEVVERMDELAGVVADPATNPGWFKRRPLPHGEYYGYLRHLREDTKPCQPCRDAFNARRRAERARKRGAA